MPFPGAHSFLIRKRLQSCIRNYLPYCSLRIAFQSKTRLSSLFRFKDIIPKKITWHLVYKFMCNWCNATCYGSQKDNSLLELLSNLVWYLFFSICVFFHNHSWITELQERGECISLTPHYHFHPLHRHLDISRAITTECSPLHIGSSRTQTENLWLLSASR